ncbi:hypothetical protein JCM10207_005884 [Rhodosporidiobolus poonsookiae]
MDEASLNDEFVRPLPLRALCAAQDRSAPRPASLAPPGARHCSPPSGLARLDDIDGTSASARIAIRDGQSATSTCAAMSVLGGLSRPPAPADSGLASHLHSHPYSQTGEEERPEDAGDTQQETLQLARTLSQRSKLGGDSNDPFLPKERAKFDAWGDNFDAAAWSKAVWDLSANDPHYGPHRTAGLAFDNLSAYGYGTDADYQSTVGNMPGKAFNMVKGLVSRQKGRKVQILEGVDGILEPGDMLVVLGPPGSGCSTFLKTLAGEAHGFYVGEESKLNYKGISAAVMKKNPTLPNLLFIMLLIFCGVLAKPDVFPKFWIFMYRISPFRYIANGLVSTGVRNALVQCTPEEFLNFTPTSGQTCGAYLAAYMASAGGYLVDENATEMCEFCTVRYTNDFLKLFSFSYNDRRRDLGISIVYVVVNFFAAIFLYWLARMPKESRKQKQSERQRVAAAGAKQRDAPMRSTQDKPFEKRVV